MQIFRVGILEKLLIAGAALCLPLAASAQESPAQAKLLDIAGIRLGMTTNQALASLAKYDSKLEITKLYYCQGTVQDSHDCFHRAKIMPLVELTTNQISSDREAHGYGEGIEVLLAPQSGRVIAVAFVRTYAPDRQPAASVIDKAILAKFPAGSVRVDTNKLEIGYFVDRDGHSLNDDITKNNKLEQGDSNQVPIMMFIANGTVPPRTIPDGGIGFVANVSDFGGTVSDIKLCLVNWDSLADAAVEEARIDKLNAEAKNADLAKQPTSTSF